MDTKENTTSPTPDDIMDLLQALAGNHKDLSEFVGMMRTLYKLSRNADLPITTRLRLSFLAGSYTVANAPSMDVLKGIKSELEVDIVEMLAKLKSEAPKICTCDRCVERRKNESTQ